MRRPRLETDGEVIPSLGRYFGVGKVVFDLSKDIYGMGELVDERARFEPPPVCRYMG
jgi:hypothetical protein